MEHRKRFGVWLCIGFLIGMALAATGCSMNLSADAFYPKGNDPREAMPWYGGAGGNNHGEGVRYHKFNKLGD